MPLYPGTDSVQGLLECLQEVKDWMALNCLKLNDSKTEVVIFGNSCDPTALGPLGSYCNDFARNLGVFMDCSFKFDRQISSVGKSSFYQLRLLSKAKSYLPYSDLERAIHAFITCRLDYCNSLYCGLDHSSIHRLQLVQNAAARLLTGTRKREHITPVLASLHWLPVSFRINFKILLMVFKCLNGLAPP